MTVIQRQQGQKNTSVFDLYYKNTKINIIFEFGGLSHIN